MNLFVTSFLLCCVIAPFKKVGEYGLVEDDGIDIRWPKNNPLSEAFFQADPINLESLVRMKWLRENTELLMLLNNKRRWLRSSRAKLPSVRLCVGHAVVQADNAPDCGVAQGVMHGVPVRHGEKQEEGGK